MLLAAIVVILATPLVERAGAQSMQTPLTPQIVEAFIASYPQVKETATGLSQQYGVDTGGADVSAVWQAWLAVTAAQGALNAACQSYGFDSFASWISTLTSIATAYAFAREGGGVNDQMATAIANIQNNPNVPEAQKQAMIQAMQASMGALGAIMPSPENVEAVMPRLAELAVLFDDD